MLRIASAFKPGTRAAKPLVSRRFAHHGVHYGPEEPLTPYLKWLAVVCGFGGLLAYDRIYTDQKLTKLVTPVGTHEEIERERQKFADRQVQEQDRNIELLYPRKRSPTEVFSPRPVPEGARRDGYTNSVPNIDELEPRRPRSRPH